MRGFALLLCPLMLLSPVRILPAMAAFAGSDAARHVQFIADDGGTRFLPLTAALWGYELPGETRQSRIAELRERAFQSPTDCENTILNLAALGIDPRDFCGRDLFAELAERLEGKHTLNAEIFALLALDSASFPDGAIARNDLIAAILSAQREDGSFALGAGTDFSSDVDVTALALCALVPAQDRAEVRDSAARALGWLSAQQQEDGSFCSAFGDREANSVSTAFAAAALARWGVFAPEHAAERAHRYVLSCQGVHAGFCYTPESEPDALTTEQVLIALAVVHTGRGAYSLGVSADALEPYTYTAPGGSLIGLAVGAAALAAACITPLLLKKRRDHAQR